MQRRTLVLVIWLAAISVNIGWAQTVVYDRAGNQYTCRAPDGTYTKPTATMHKYDIAAAMAAHEPHDPHDPHHPHDAICIDATQNHRITWSWPGANHIAVFRFVPITNDGPTGTCWTSKHPFIGTAANSGANSFLLSGATDNHFAWCAYDVKFTSSLGPYDPHIIIKGTKASLLEALRERVKYLENVIDKLEDKKENNEK